MGRLSGKAAAITGGASGIGEATARLFAEEGALVAIADLDVERGRSVAAEIQAKGGSAIFVETRTERESEAAAFVRRAQQEFGRLDILVNNAGMRLYQTVVEATEASWDAILGVNLKGYAFCAKAAIPEMRRTGGGSIVNVASIRALVAGPAMPQYDTTKAAVTGLTRSMARDHAGEGIRVNAVCPGNVHTPMLETFTGGDEKALLGMGRVTPIGRLAEPAEIAEAIIWLCSDAASFVTGHAMAVDGGVLAT